MQNTKRAPLLTKSEGLAAACRCDTNEVMTRHDDRPHLALYGRWLRKLPGGVQHVGRKARMLKPIIHRDTTDHAYQAFPNLSA